MPPRVIVDFFKQVDQQIKTGSHNTIDLKIVLAFGIAGFTIMEVGANAATPVWVTLAMFGLEPSDRSEHAREAQEDEEGDGALAPA